MKQNGVVLEPSELSPHAPLEDTFKLHSYPKGQTDQILYLDFDGHSPARGVQAFRPRWGPRDLQCRRADGHTAGLAFDLRGLHPVEH